MLMHGIVMTWVSVHVLVTCLVHAVLSEEPKVTLSHGGQLRGKNITYNGTNVDLFLGKLVSINSRAWILLPYIM